MAEKTGIKNFYEIESNFYEVERNFYEIEQNFYEVERTFFWKPCFMRVSGVPEEPNTIIS